MSACFHEVQSEQDFSDLDWDYPAPSRISHLLPVLHFGWPEVFLPSDYCSALTS